LKPEKKHTTLFHLRAERRKGQTEQREEDHQGCEDMELSFFERLNVKSDRGGISDLGLRADIRLTKEIPSTPIL